MTFRSNFVASIKSDGKILREIDNQVILPFQTEYSILLKNLDTRKASVQVSIDGQDVLYGKSLILNPNTSIELERFVDDLDKGGKFKFIKKTQEISDYRGDKIDDGLVRIEYNFEKYRQELTHPYAIKYQEYFPFTTKYPSIVCDAVANKSLRLTNDSSQVNINSLCSTAFTIVEDGITVQGSKSEQQFHIGCIGALEENSYVIVIGLKGSDKITAPITVKTKVQCPTCGRTSKDRFCGNCGTSLVIY